MNNYSLIKVSIITICYNSKKTIEQTILSVISQTYLNIEYIIIDGGSTDGTLEIIKKYQSKIAYWKSEPDNGISDAWNKGLDKATGEIIGIINSDDWYEEQAVGKAVNVFQENPDIGFVFGDLIFIGEQGNILFMQKGDPYYSKSIQYEMPPIPHPTVFVRKWVYEKNGVFDLNYKTALDYEFLLRIYKAGVKGLYINQTLVTMMLGGESDVNFRRACQEVARASIKYGYPPFRANLRLYLKLFKSRMRRMIDKTGASLLTRLYRKLFHKHIYYNQIGKAKG